MLQRTQTVSALVKLRERAFEAAFFGVTLIAMAGWVYFIVLLMIKSFIWIFS